MLFPRQEPGRGQCVGVAADDGAAEHRVLLGLLWLPGSVRGISLGLTVGSGATRMCGLGDVGSVGLQFRVFW